MGDYLAIEWGKDKPEIEKYCKHCKTGLLHELNRTAKVEKRIGFIKYLAREQELGYTCAPCIHNGIGGKAARKMVKKYSTFQSVDNFRPREGESNAR